MGGANPIDEFDALLKAAKSGDREAQNRLGDAYALGKGTVANPKKGDNHA